MGKQQKNTIYIQYIYIYTIYIYIYLYIYIYNNYIYKMQSRPVSGEAVACLTSSEVRLKPSCKAASISGFF